MDCSTCKDHKRVLEPVPYVAHESAMARAERTIKRLVTVLVIILCLWFATIGAFVWYLNQYDFESYTETYEYTQDGRGLNIIGDSNGVDYNVTETGIPENEPEAD